MRAGLKRQAARLGRYFSRLGGQWPTSYHETQPFPRQTLLQRGYQSQFGQDRFLHETYFGNVSAGTFVEIGAHDGVYLSNTHFFEKELGWSGVCVEPHPEVFERLRANRECRCVNACIADQDGTIDFLQITGRSELYSGVAGTFHPRHVRRIKRRLHRGGGSQEVVGIPSMRLDRLLDEAGLGHVDYLSIDTEGNELDVLRSVDFSRWSIGVIDVENNYRDSRIRERLQSAGFGFVTRIGVDEIFVRNVRSMEVDGDRIRNLKE